MSLIDQALKKTQSAQNQRARTPDSPQTSTKKQPRAATPSSSAPMRPPIDMLKKRKKITILSFIKTLLANIWFTTLTATLAGIAFIFIACQHVTKIEQFYASLYHHLFASHLASTMISQKAMTPALPTPAATQTNTQLELDGTLQINHERAALINHELYRTGQAVDGYRVDLIRYNEVTLFNPQTQKTLQLTPNLNQ